MNQGDFHTFGDAWYNMSYPGMGYLFIKGTGSAPTVQFSYGYKPLFPQWAILAISISGGCLLLICLFICCCYIRRKAAEKANETTKVKKYGSKSNVSITDKISRYKYGRESAPISMPELAENEDEMNKPQDEWGGPMDDQDDNLDFHQLEEPTNYNWQG